MEGLELISFQIISAVGTAKSMYVEAMQLARLNQFENARDKIKEGETFFLEGHKAHSGLIQSEARGEKTEYSLILMHAEDQLMNAETLKITAEEIIHVYERVNQVN